MSNYSSPVGVAQDNTGSHIDEFIHKKQTALEHFLVNKYTSLGLCSNNQEDTQQVRSQTRPWSICYGHNGTIYKCINLIFFLRRDINIITSDLKINTHATESHWYNTKF